MNKPALLLERIHEIVQELIQIPEALALIGLGSTGAEQDRLDEHSDLDFFVIVSSGTKSKFIENLNWLEKICPIVFAFQNTPDGYKLLFQDGVFAEFAVFEPDEINQIPYHADRIIWERFPGAGPTSNVQILMTNNTPKDKTWLVNEALTNLYVGLHRLERGEKMSGFRFIQQYAVERVMEMAPYIEKEHHDFVDPFGIERRFENRFPQTSQKLPKFIQGYNRSKESALELLSFLESNFEINGLIAVEIRELCRGN